MEEKKGINVVRILGIVIGVLIVALGIYCMFTPISTYGVVGWIIAFGLIADGVSKIVLWKDLRKAGVSDIWALVGGILSCVLGVVLACSQVAMVAVDIFVAYLVGVWVLLAGCVRIARSFAMRNVRVELDGVVLANNWDLALIIGILMVVLGIFCLANPLLVVIAIGWQIGFALILGGAGLISATA
ncbi:MAG: DUF308 domain-containing protein [Coriobacteriales bacterium]|nr:DUF308 domain-containing protein [Coriobacteriales bacterium]